MSRRRGGSASTRAQIAQWAAGAGESELQRAILELAKMLGWMAYHTFDSRRSAEGFPDLVLVRGDRVLFVELKSDTGQLRPAQVSWLDALWQVEHVETYLWRPDDLVAASRILGRTFEPGNARSWRDNDPEPS